MQSESIEPKGKEKRRKDTLKLCHCKRVFIRSKTAKPLEVFGHELKLYVWVALLMESKLGRR